MAQGRADGGVRGRQAAASRDRLGRVLHSRALTYFAIVAETLSIRGAARRLQIAPSAVNRQILLFEAAVGLQLFHRQGRALALSPAGEVLARHARLTVADLDSAIEEVEALQGLATGAVRVASIDSFATGRLAPIVLEFASRYPRIKVNVSVQPSRQTNGLVAAGQADIGFTINPPPDRSYGVVESHALPVGALMAPGHPLARRQRLTIADCLPYPVLRGTRAEIEALIEQAKPGTGAFIESNSSRFKASLVVRGEHIAFSPALGLERDIGDGRLVFVPLIEPGLVSDRFAIIQHGVSLRPAPQRFLDFVREALAVQGPDSFSIPRLSAGRRAAASRTSRDR